MVETLLIGVALLSLANIVLLAVLLRRGAGADLSPLWDKFDSIESGHDKAAAAIRDELSRGRFESTEAARLLREEVGASAKATLDSLLRGVGGIGEQQGTRLDGFAAQLTKANEASQENARLLRAEVGKSTQLWTDATLSQVKL